MKLHRTLLGCTALLLAVSVSGARADQAAFSAKAKSLSGLIGYWAFEGNYDDQSGKGNNAKTAGDASLITFCQGVKGGQGVQFDNATKTGQRLSVAAPVGGVFDVPNMSAFCWAKITSKAEADHWDNVFDRTSLWYIETQWKEQDDGSLVMDLVNRIYDPENPNNGGTGQVRSLQADSPVGIKGNEWHLIGFTYDGKQLISYIDAKRVAQTDYDGGVGPTANTPAPAKAGKFDLNWGAWDAEDDWSNGCFDDTVIYSRALSADEVKSLVDAMMQ